MNKLETRAAALRDFNLTAKVVMQAASGDDLYVIIEKDGKFEYGKYLYDGNAKSGILQTHELSDHQIFETRGAACVYLAEKLLDEETGYAQGE